MQLMLLRGRRHRLQGTLTIIPPFPICPLRTTLTTFWDFSLSKIAEHRLVIRERVLEPLEIWRKRVRARLWVVVERNGSKNAAFFLWLILESYWDFVDNNLELVFQDPRFPEIRQTRQAGFCTSFRSIQKESLG